MHILRIFIATLLIAISTSPALAAESARVTSVIDGDTVKVKLGKKTETVRIIGIDAPEMKDPKTRKPQCYSREATSLLKALVSRKTVTMETGAEDRDVYKRLLRYLSVDDLDVGAAMIVEGAAMSYRKYPHARLEDYNTLEETARDASDGRWSACATARQERTSGPSQGTTGQGASAGAAVPAGTKATTQQCGIKGNIAGDGEKIYHVRGCASYERTKIDEGAGERYFCSEAEAREAGWRKAGNC